MKIQRFKIDHNVVLGQSVPAKPGSVPYVMLRCARCSNMIEPRIVHATRDVAGGGYDHFLDTMEGKDDKREKKQEEAAVPTQEL
jgi:hypothetical protein